MTTPQLIEALRRRPDAVCRMAANRLEKYCPPPLPSDDELAQWIIETVAKAYRRTPEELVSGRRFYKLAVPRHVAMYLCRLLLRNNAYGAIGTYFGGRHHTTVMSAIQGVESRLRSDWLLRAGVRALRDELTGTEEEHSVAA